MEGSETRAAAQVFGVVASILVFVAFGWSYSTFVKKQETYTATITICSTEDRYTEEGHDYVLHLPDDKAVFMDVEETPWGAVRRDRLDTEKVFERLAQDVATYGPSTYDVTIKGVSWMVFPAKPNVITYSLANVQSPQLCKPKEALTA